MNYNEFKNAVQAVPIIFSRDMIRYKVSPQIIRNQLERWHSRKLLLKLKRGVFLLNKNDRKINPSRAYIANQLYHPSYVSLEYALNYYGLIPEKVTDVTSVTTKKTMRIGNELGSFIYQHIKVKAFKGIKAVKDEAGLLYFMAEAEKAVVDFFYLNLSGFKGRHEDVFETAYRFQNVEILKTEKLLMYAGLFDSAKLTRVSEEFCKLIKKEGGK